MYPAWTCTWEYNKKTRPKCNKEKKWTCQQVNLAILADYTLRIKENEKKKNLDLAWEFKMLRNIKVTVIPIIVGAHRTNP